MRVRTYENTEFTTWWKLARDAFLVRGLPSPLYGETKDAYEMGESPESWADFVAFTEERPNR